MPLSSMRRAINRHIPLTGLGWLVAACLILAATIALNILMEYR